MVTNILFCTIHQVRYRRSFKYLLAILISKSYMIYFCDYTVQVPPNSQQSSQLKHCKLYQRAFELHYTRNVCKLYMILHISKRSFTNCSMKLVQTLSLDCTLGNLQVVYWYGLKSQVSNCICKITLGCFTHEIIFYCILVHPALTN